MEKRKKREDRERIEKENKGYRIHSERRTGIRGSERGRN